MSEEFYNSGFRQDEDFDYSPINSQNSASDSLNDNNSGEVSNDSSACQPSASESVVPQNDKEIKTGSRVRLSAKVIICIIVVVSLIICLLKTFFGVYRKNIVYEAARMAPRGSVAVIALDLREEKNLNNLFGGLLQGLAGNTVLKAQLSQVLPAEINFSFIQDLAIHAEGAGALIACLPGEDTPGLCVYMQKFKPKAPIEQMMKSFQDLSVKKNPGLKYVTVPTFDGFISCPGDNQRGFSWIIQGNTLFVGTSGQDLNTILATREERDSLLAEPNFQKYVGKIDGDTLGVGFINCQHFIKSSGLVQILETDHADTDLIKFVEAIQCVSFKSKIGRTKTGKQINFSAQFVCDSQDIGRYGKRFLNKANNIDFQSLKYHPNANSSLISVNIQTVWKIVYDIMGLTPEGRERRQIPDEMLRRVGSSMDKLLSMLTGEFTVSIDGLSRLQGEQFVNVATSNPHKAASMPVVVTLGLKNGGDFEGFLLSLPSVPLFAAMCPSYDINNCRVYKIPFGRNTFLTITNDQLVAAFNMESQTTFDDMLSGKYAKTWADVPLIKQAAQEGKLCGLVFSCEDIKANRNDAAAGIKSRLSSAVLGDKKMLEIFCQALEDMGRTMGYGYSVVSLQEDGCVMSGVAEIKKNSIPVNVDPKKDNTK